MACIKIQAQVNFCVIQSIKFLSFEFINVFALAIVSRVFPDLDIIKFKLIFFSLK